MNGHKYPRDWEPINGGLQRIRIPGAWLVRSSTTLLIGAKEVYASEALIRIDDVDGDWVLEKS